MALQVVSGAMLECTFGMAPSTLNVLPTNRVTAGGPPAANIMDHVPEVNILSFGMCMSIANPEVAAATAAAMGVLTPMPCIPVVPDPWDPGAPTVQLAQFPALDNTSICMCTWEGIISITDPGQETVEIP